MSKAATVGRCTYSALRILLAPVSKATSVKLPGFSFYLLFFFFLQRLPVLLLIHNCLFGNTMFPLQNRIKVKVTISGKLASFGTFRGARGKQTSFRVTPSSATACRVLDKDILGQRRTSQGRISGCLQRDKTLSSVTASFPLSWAHGLWASTQGLR